MKTSVQEKHFSNIHPRTSSSKSIKHRIMPNVNSTSSGRAKFKRNLLYENSPDALNSINQYKIKRSSVKRFSSKNKFLVHCLENSPSSKKSFFRMQCAETKESSPLTIVSCDKTFSPRLITRCESEVHVETKQKAEKGIFNRKASSSRSTPQLRRLTPVHLSKKNPVKVIKITKTPRISPSPQKQWAEGPLQAQPFRDLLARTKSLLKYFSKPVF